MKTQFYADVDLEFYITSRRVYAFKGCNLELNFVRMGIHFGTLEEDGLRLSIEGSFIVGKVAKKNIIELSDEDAIKWLKGENLEVNKELKGYYIIKWMEYFLGCGKALNGKLINFVPKDRRIS
ncbi:MAG: hypothetical protein NZ922_00910 [Candidatus Methanomethyliaceae archaeon]|nr:hypothetical protein [Candidatus Methanomethyliaceae archaeon]MCX8169852.1 hypothetical protein [Candidatus Methanomethyliaceae archaeon]MDW7970263.1 hypothetical protein [Nitrososphaerota archaeon]